MSHHARYRPRRDERRSVPIYVKGRPSDCTIDRWRSFIQKCRNDCDRFIGHPAHVVFVNPNQLSPECP